MKNLLTILSVFLCASVFAQINTELLGSFSYESSLSDIWGYIDEDGNEYALVGKRNGVSVVDVSDPANLDEVFVVDGPSSIWRDLKVWNDHAYVTNETGNGLLIIDLSPLPTSHDLPVVRYTDGGWDNAHNLYIDENGICYIFGADRDNGGVIMYDLTQHATELVEVGKFENWYVHDGMARGDTLYLGHINDGIFSIVDVSDKQNPVLLGTKVTSFNFTHNVWVSDDGDYLFTTDERSDAYIGAYDISDLNDIEEIDLYQSSEGGVIPHNVHYLDGFLVTSYYRDGLDITDVSRPNNIIRVGSYDTADDMEGNGFNGAWGAYPYLPSGNILVSDIEKGLFVIGFNYERACFLEGRVFREGSSVPLNQINVDVADFSTQTDISGEFLTGTPNAGNYDVTFSRQGYLPKTLNLDLVNGELIDTTVYLELDTRFGITIEIVDQDGIALSDVNVQLYAQVDTFYTVSNDSGYAFVDNVFPADYIVHTGKWGYQTTCDSVYFDELDSMETVTIEERYYDDFSMDFSWEINSTASKGAFVREKPNPTFDDGSSVQPGYDAYGDCFDFAFITGNAYTEEIAEDDIDDGMTSISSPIMDLSSNTNTFINYYHWLYLKSFGSQNPNDSLNVWVTNGADSVMIESFDHSSAQRDWVYSSIQIDGLIDVTDEMRVHFIAADNSPGHVFEVGIDVFSVSEEELQSTTDKVSSKNRILLYPNPMLTGEQMNFNRILSRVEVYNMTGQLVLENENQSGISTKGLKSGMYIVKLIDGSYEQIDKVILK